MTDDTAPVVATVEGGEAVLRRSLQMKFFAAKQAIKNVSIASLEMKDGGKPRNPAHASITVGQVVGTIFDVQEKIGKLPNGDVSTSLLAIGEFEAVCYETGEVITTNAAYLPTYYLETARAAMSKDDCNRAILCALEIVMEATGKSVPYAYMVRPLIQRRPENPLNRLKAELQRHGRLRLPPPPEASHEVDTLAAGALEGVTSEPEYETTTAEESASVDVDPPKSKGK
jgi:hypothetical protein